MIFIPAGVPPHKPDPPEAGQEERYQMTVLATEDNPAFEVSRFEVDRKCPSYTVDTLAEFRRIYGGNAHLFFITGADTILEILTWYHPERLIKMCKLVAATRPGYDLQEVTERLPKEFINQTIFLETPEIGISSTELRSRVAGGNSIKYLTPRAVENYIYENGLYGARK
jgi:nicotinate-nucleotide adenylyltransferase